MFRRLFPSFQYDFNVCNNAQCIHNTITNYTSYSHDHFVFSRFSACARVFHPRCTSMLFLLMLLFPIDPCCHLDRLFISPLRFLWFHLLIPLPPVLTPCSYFFALLSPRHISPGLRFSFFLLRL